MHDYQLVVRTKFEALDDVEARKKACEMMRKVGVRKTVVKLQRLREGFEPHGLKFSEGGEIYHVIKEAEER